MYNIYNCTRLRELREWADQQGLKIHWQTLYQPEYLDPGLHGSAVKLLAVDEILAYRAAFDLAADEDAFFQAVQERFQQTSDDASQRLEFQQHIDLTEHQYHRTDDPRRFCDLWPELAFMME